MTLPDLEHLIDDTHFLPHREPRMLEDSTA